MGILVSYSVVRSAPEGMECYAPYVVGIVCVGKTYAIAQISDVDVHNLRVGMRMVGRLRRLFTAKHVDLITYGVKFCPVVGLYKRNN